MSRFHCLALLAPLLAAPVAAQDAGRDDPAPTGLIFIEARIDPQHVQSGAFPPEGIAVKHQEFRNCILFAKLTVPIERELEVRALLKSMAPQSFCPHQPATKF
jgi:hypothetical protein